MVHRGLYHCLAVWESDAITSRNSRIRFGSFLVALAVAGFITSIVVYKNFGKRNTEALLVVLVYF